MLQVLSTDMCLSLANKQVSGTIFLVDALLHHEVQWRLMERLFRLLFTTFFYEGLGARLVLMKKTMMVKMNE